MSAPAYLDSYLRRWNRIHQQSRRIVAAAPSDKYDWKPCDSAMSLGELVNHLWISEAGLIEAAVTGAFPKERAKPLNDTAAVLTRSDQAHEEAVAKVVTLTAEQLDEEIVPFGPDKHLTRRAVLEATLEHEIHHRGQLCTFLRVVGCEMPLLFAPETIHEFND